MTNRHVGSKNENSPPVRVPNTTAVIPIVYGSISFFLGKKASEEHTHRWTLYVRGPNDEDLSVAISKIIFHLHPSFPQPVRELSSPPFEVTEKGWGEFEATIRVVWHDPHERATVLTHFIKLYPTIVPSTNSGNDNTGSTSTSGSSSNNKKEPVIHEFYDEVVFTDPTETFHEQLQRWSSLPKIKSKEESIHEYLPVYGDEEDFNVLLEAQRFLEAQLTEIKDRILKADTESQDIVNQIMTLTNPQSTTSNNNTIAVSAVPAMATTGGVTGQLLPNSNTKNNSMKGAYTAATATTKKHTNIGSSNKSINTSGRSSNINNTAGNSKKVSGSASSKKQKTSS